MSEQPSNVSSLDEYRRSRETQTRLDDNTDVALHLGRDDLRSYADIDKERDEVARSYTVNKVEKEADVLSVSAATRDLRNLVIVRRDKLGLMSSEPEALTAEQLEVAA